MLLSNQPVFPVKHFVTPRVPSINIGGQLMSFDRPKIMGILNVTPDSFYDGGTHTTVDQAVAAASELLAAGADLLDIGAQSTRPGAVLCTAQEESARLIPVVQAISKAFPDAFLSIDTFCSTVAEEAILAGAHIINDVSGGTMDAQMFAVIAQYQVPYILMHMRGTPQTMNQHTQYDDVVTDVAAELGHAVAQLRRMGVRDILLDPGFGFSKTIAQNYELLFRLEELHYLGLPVVAGVSRKSMIYRKLDIQPADALPGTIALQTLLLERGTHILRVHDVSEARQIVDLFHF